MREVATGADLDDRIEWSKFSGASWALDGSGFYYSRYAAPDATTQFKDGNYDHKLYFHRLGAEQSADTLIYERPDHPDWNMQWLCDGRRALADRERIARNRSE